MLRMVDEANRRGGKDTTVQILKVNSGKRYKAKNLGIDQSFDLILPSLPQSWVWRRLEPDSTFHLGFSRKINMLNLAPNRAYYKQPRLNSQGFLENQRK